MKKKILLVENNSSVREQLKCYLEAKGYYVFSADGPEQATELLQKKWVHLAIIDLRLVDDREPSDIKGLALAELAKKIYPELPVIIFTGYEIKDEVVNVVDFTFDTVKKRDGPKALLEKVEQVFENKVGINFELEIRFSCDLNFERLIKVLGFEDEMDEELTEELTDLFRILYNDAEKITIYPMQPGHGGAGVVRIVPERRSLVGNDVVVKFGIRELVEKENENYENYVKGILMRERHTVVDKFARTLHFGGIVYNLIGSSRGGARTFKEFYEERSAKEIENAVMDLFTKTCDSWYGGRGALTIEDLADECRSNVSLRGKAIIDAFKNYFSNFKKINLNYSDKQKCFNDLMRWIEDMDFSCRVSHCITHGDLHENNFFVDKHGNTWLIDFFKTGESYLLRDFIMLEATIKFSLLKEDINLEALYELEEALLAQEQFGRGNDLYQFTGDGAEELSKAFRVIKKIRSLTHLRSGCNVTMGEYYGGLLFQSLEFVCKRINGINKEYALLSAIMIGKKLG